VDDVVAPHTIPKAKSDYRPVYARGMATAVPLHEARQDEMRDFMVRSAHIAPERMGRMSRVCANSGVKRRYAAVPPKNMEGLRRWPARNAAFLQCADALLVEANQKALAQAGLTPDDIDVIVSINTTCTVAPDLAARQIGLLGLRPDVRRVPLYGFGCAGGAAGLTQATEIARTHPGSRVLLQVIELCLVNLDPETDSEPHFVAAALFGDGAASIVLSTDGPGLCSVGQGREHCWPGTTHALGWHPGDVGLTITLHPILPKIIRAQFRAVAEHFFEEVELDQDSIENYIAHPGSLRIVDAVEESLMLSKGTLADTREVWANYSNMSAATVFFVMKNALDRHASGPFLMTAFGPGLTAALVEGEIACA
jgi:alkylresorcinol/alkylpyrone synthase